MSAALLRAGTRHARAHEHEALAADHAVHDLNVAPLERAAGDRKAAAAVDDAARERAVEFHRAAGAARESAVGRANVAATAGERAIDRVGAAAARERAVLGFDIAVAA